MSIQIGGEKCALLKSVKPRWLLQILGYPHVATMDSATDSVIILSEYTKTEHPHFLLLNSGVPEQLSRSKIKQIIFAHKLKVTIWAKKSCVTMINISPYTRLP